MLLDQFLMQLQPHHPEWVMLMYPLIRMRFPQGHYCELERGKGVDLGRGWFGANQQPVPS